jgi:Na+/phosphate symporter
VKADTVLELGFAAGIVVASAALALASFARATRRTLIGLASLLGLAAAAAWIGFAFELDRASALAAAGLSVCCLAAVAAIPLLAGVLRARRLDEEFGDAEARLASLIQREAAQRAEELERTLARARADSSSMLAEEERRLAEARRAEVTDRERRAAAELGDALTLAERRVEKRLSEWSTDLDRIQQALTSRLAELAQKQRDLIAEANTRMEADAVQLKAASEEQRETLKRMREEFERVTEEAAGAARRDVEVHEAERRRALHEVAERLRQRERELRDRVAAEETEAVRRIQAGFADVERRQIDQLTRIVDRTANRLSEAAVEEFTRAVKAAREDAARRLSRELDRAVAQFSHDAQSVLAERLAQVSDSGAARIDRKLGEIVNAIEHRRDEFLTDFQRRVSDTEAELRAQIRAIGADAEAERAVLEARLHDLTRRLESGLPESEATVQAAFRAE